MRERTGAKAPQPPHDDVVRGAWIRREAVDAERDAVVGDAIAEAQEAEEQLEHVGVGAREEHRVAALRPLGPVEHASLWAEKLRLANQLAAVALGSFACGAR
jgi:hypothetical protein